MKNCLILGFGRSGTSLMGGLLYRAGYFLGDHLHPARPTNPKGFFEDIVINRINELILEGFDYSKVHASYPRFAKPHSPFFPRRGHRWLTMIEPGTPIVCDNEAILGQIRKAVALDRPFAFKDPRFNFTLPVWQRVLPESARYICMFRNPAAVVESVIKECRSVNYLKDFYIDEDLAFLIWHNSYRHLLDTLTPDSRRKVFFVSYEDLLEKKSLKEIAALLDAPLQDDWIDPSLNRSPSRRICPSGCERLYGELLALAARQDG